VSGPCPHLASSSLHPRRALAPRPQIKSWQDFAHLFTEGRLDVYTLVPIFWALYNSTAPLLFFVYFFTKASGPLGGGWEGAVCWSAWGLSRRAAPGGAQGADQ
jgi:hypothetical protein